jgi:hypothetical protein
MSNQNFIYIAREYLIGDHSLIRIDEESIFDSFEKAQIFLSTLREEYDPEDLNDPHFRHEIIKKPLNSNDAWKLTKTWVYKIDGNLLLEYPNENTDKNDFDLYNYEGLFKVGEIVKIKNSMDEPNLSNFVNDNYGVVSETPINKEAWKLEENSLDEWDGAYLVWFITENGNVSHLHLRERALSQLTSALPEQYVFLNNISKYFRKDCGEKEAEEILKAMSEDVFVQKVNYFFNKKN